VVGGGDTALEEAFYLTKYGKHVHLFVRGKAMRGSKTMQVISYCCRAGSMLSLSGSINSNKRAMFSP
jgi:hypothetical protein